MARVAIVTGGTRGIGEAISVALHDQGMKVAANYAGNDERAREFTERTGIPAFKWDVSDFDACQKGVAQVEAEIGPVDVLVNNAGITRDTTMKRMDHQKWQEVMDTNLGGCFNMAKAVWEGMMGRGYGRIGNPRLHQGAGAGRCALRRDRERDRAGLHRYRHGRRSAAGSAPEDHRPHSG
jgi:acetoacetyl-CoA reductase